MLDTKLTLQIVCNGYNNARKLRVELGSRGFDAGVSSPMRDVYAVVVTSRPQTVNYGKSCFEELRLAHETAELFFASLTEVS